MIESPSQNRVIGYARVSTYGQTLDAQLEQLEAAGCVKTYREQASGAKVERREMQRMLQDLAPGDVVTVTRIDRLARLICRRRLPVAFPAPAAATAGTSWPTWRCSSSPLRRSWRSWIVSGSGCTVEAASRT